MANTNRRWMNPPMVVDVTSPRSHKTSKITKIVQSIRFLLSMRFELYSPGSRREKLEWKEALTDQCLGFGPPPINHTRAADLCSFPTPILDEGNELDCSLVHSPRYFFVAQSPACAVMRRRKSAIMLRDAGRTQIATCLFAHLAWSAPSAT